MNRLTPELWAISQFAKLNGATTLVTDTRELDFNLARRSAVIINQVRGFLSIVPGTTTGFDAVGAAVQELDVDPDNVVPWNLGTVLKNDGVELDSSRVFRQRVARSLDTASGTVTSSETTQKMDWTNLPLEHRPISITNLRHHIAAYTGIAGSFEGELYIKYFIVELSLWELGVINASRR